MFHLQQTKNAHQMLLPLILVSLLIASVFFGGRSTEASPLVAASQQEELPAGVAISPYETLGLFGAGSGLLQLPTTAGDDSELLMEPLDKRAPMDRSALVRFGKRAPMDRSALVRFGKRAPMDRSALVRFGKRFDYMMNSFL